jgi:hypothetical protein
MDGHGAAATAITMIVSRLTSLAGDVIIVRRANKDRSSRPTTSKRRHERCRPSGLGATRALRGGTRIATEDSMMKTDTTTTTRRHLFTSMPAAAAAMALPTAATALGDELPLPACRGRAARSTDGDAHPGGTWEPNRRSLK